MKKKCAFLTMILVGVWSASALGLTVTDPDFSFEVTGPGATFVDWALTTAGGSRGGTGVFATYNTAYTNNTTVSGSAYPNTTGWLEIPFTFCGPLENATISYSSEARSYSGNVGLCEIYVVVGGVETLVYRHANSDLVTSQVLTSAEAYYNYYGNAPTGDGIFCTSTDISDLVEGATSFSIKFVSTMGYSAWLYNGGVFMPSDGASTDFELTGDIEYYVMPIDSEDGTFELNAPGATFTDWGLGFGGTVDGEDSATFATYNTAYTNNTTISGSDTPYKKAWMTVPFLFPAPLETATISFNSEARWYSNNDGVAEIYLIVDEVETLLYRHVNSSLIDREVFTTETGYYNYNGTEPTGDGIFCTSTDFSDLVEGETEFSLRFESKLGWSQWLYNGGVFMASDGASPNFSLTGGTTGFVYNGRLFTLVTEDAESCQVTPTSEHTTAGLIPYARPDLTEYVHPLSAPQTGETLTQIDLSAARDEYESARILVYGLDDIEDLVFEYTPSAGSGGLSADWVELAYIPFRLERLTYEGSDVHMNARIILPVAVDQEFEVETGTTSVFYVTTKTPADAEAGAYSGTLSLGSDSGSKVSIPLNLTVHPFELDAPSHQIGCYVESWQPLEDVYAHMQEYGFRAASLSFAMPDLVLDNGHWVLETEDIIDYIQEYLGDETNPPMSPPLPLELARLSTELAKKLNLYDSLAKDPVTDASDMICPMTEEDYPQALRDAYEYAIGALWDDLEAANLEQAVVLYPIDEPTANYHRMPMARIQTALIRSAAPDAKIYVTVHDITRTAELATYGALDIAVVSLWLFADNPSGWESLASTYDLTLNCYRGISTLRPTGLTLVKYDLERLMIWTSYLAMANADDPLADLSASLKAFALFLPSSTGYKNTLDFDMLRDAVDDMRYFATAERHVEEKEASAEPSDQARAATARTELDSIISGFSNFQSATIAECEAARSDLAEIITEMSKGLTVVPDSGSSFEVVGPGATFTDWALGIGATIEGQDSATFSTYNHLHTDYTTISGSDTPYKKASLTIPFHFLTPLENATISFNSEARWYSNHNGYAAIYVIVDEVETLVYRHVNSDLIDREVYTTETGYYNYDGTEPTGDGIFCTSTDISDLVEGKTSFSIKFESQVGWSLWLYNGGVFMASDGASPNFTLAGDVYQVSVDSAGEFDLTGSGSNFTNWALGLGATIDGEYNATFDTYSSTYTNNTTISGGDTPWRKASLTIPFYFSLPLETATICYNSEARWYANNPAYAAIYVIVDEVETLVYRHANSDLIDREVYTTETGYYNYNGNAPTGDGICCTSTDISDLVGGETAFSVRFESQMGWSNWLYNGGVFMASDGTSTDFNLSGSVISLCPGDANYDGIVDEDDFDILVENWYSTGGWAEGDFNGDGYIDELDLLILAMNWS